MAGEVTIQSNITIRGTAAAGNLNVQYGRTLPSSHTGDMLSNKGPSPGYMKAQAIALGTAVPLSSLASPGYYRIINYDSVNFVELGLEVSAAFQALEIIRPGNSYVGELSPNIVVANLRVRADTADCDISFECWDRTP